MPPNDIVIITSAALVGDEIAAELGPLPPTFLPMGHERLFRRQLDSLQCFKSRTVITLPLNHIMPAWDLAALEQKQVEVVFVPNGLSLGQSVLFTLAHLRASGSIRILHGDTLFLSPLPSDLNVVSIAEAPADYAWGFVDKSGTFSSMATGSDASRTILTGFFSFSHAHELLRALAISNGDFLKALNCYSKTYSLAPREIKGWLDCGHVQTYYQSRAAFGTARSFNDLKISPNVVEKSSADCKKIAAEAAWFEKLPALLRLHIPAYLGTGISERGDPSYKLAFEYNPTLHELYVFGALKPDTWKILLESCFQLLNAFLAHTPQESNNPLSVLLQEKSKIRLDSLARSGLVDIHKEWRYAGKQLPSLVKIAEQCTDLVDISDTQYIGIMHGDFCFSNIFYDFRQRLIKVIDPRGSVDGLTPTVYGDVRYDLAKLNHSLQGYDLILGGRFLLTGFENQNPTLEFADESAASLLPTIAESYTVKGLNLSHPEIVASTIHLFLSMAPLHADHPSRQRAFIANALRLFYNLERKGL